MEWAVLIVFQIGSFNLNIMPYLSQMGDNLKTKGTFFSRTFKVGEKNMPSESRSFACWPRYGRFVKCLPFNVRKRPYLKLLKEKFNKAKITNWVKFAYIFNRQIAHTMLYELAIGFWVEIYFQSIREAFQTKKRGNLGNGPKWRWPPPSRVGTFLKWVDPPPPKINLGLFKIGMTP